MTPDDWNAPPYTPAPKRQDGPDHWPAGMEPPSADDLELNPEVLADLELDHAQAGAVTDILALMPSAYIPDPRDIPPLELLGPTLLNYYAGPLEAEPLVELKVPANDTSPPAIIALIPLVPLLAPVFDLMAEALNMPRRRPAQPLEDTVLLEGRTLSWGPNWQPGATIPAPPAEATRDPFTGRLYHPGGDPRFPLGPDDPDA